MEQNSIKYYKLGSKWGFTAIFDKWSISCNGFSSKIKAKATFERLKSKGLGELKQ